MNLSVRLVVFWLAINEIYLQQRVAQHSPSLGILFIVGRGEGGQTAVAAATSKFQSKLFAFLSCAWWRWYYYNLQSIKDRVCVGGEAPSRRAFHGDNEGLSWSSLKTKKVPFFGASWQWRRGLDVALSHWKVMLLYNVKTIKKFQRRGSEKGDWSLVFWLKEARKFL